MVRVRCVCVQLEGSYMVHMRAHANAVTRPARWRQRSPFRQLVSPVQCVASAQSHRRRGELLRAAAHAQADAASVRKMLPKRRRVWHA